MPTTGWPRSVLVTLIFGFLLVSGGASSAERVVEVASQSASPLSLNDYFSILEDPLQRLGLEDVRRPEMASRFKSDQPPSDGVNLGFTPSAYWFRLTLRNSGDQPLTRMLEIGFGRISSVQFHAPQADGRYRMIQTGMAYPLETRPYKNRFFVFPVTLPPHSEQVYYFRFQSMSSLLVPGKLWMPEAFHRHERNDYLGQSWYFGIVTAMVIFNLLLFIVLRDVLYLLYVSFVFCAAMALASQNGLVKEFVSLNNAYLYEILPVYGYSLAAVFFLFFMRRMLNTPMVAPRMDRVIQGFVAIHGLFMIGIYADYVAFAKPVTWLYVSTVFLIMGTATYCASKRERSAIVFVMIFSILFVSAAMNSLTALGFLPATIVTKNVLQLGSITEMLLLSLALADRFNAIRREKERAQQEALAAQGEVLKAQIASREAAEAANQAKSQFIGSMSHELRTPLNSVLGYAQLLLSDRKLDADSREMVTDIESAGRHLLALVNDVIDLAKIESNKLVITMEPVQLYSVVTGCINMVEATARARNIALAIDEGDGSCRTVSVLADGVRLRQVIVNLLTNAIKYNRPLGYVKVSCEIRNAMVRLRVMDNGSGIAAGYQSRIFNVFDRLGKEAGAIEGTGVGLNIAKHLTEAMGGTIGFTSEEGKGSTFWIELPVLAVVPDPEEVAPPSTDVRTMPSPSRDAIVLYVEDNLMNYRLMASIFSRLSRQSHVELCHAQSAGMGIELARRLKPTLILMDINLPDMNGYQALQTLRADSVTADIPVVAISASAMLGDRERGLAAGFADYITKPIDVDILMGVLGRYLKTSK